MPFTTIGEAAYGVVRSVAPERDLRPLAALFAEAMLDAGIDVADEREVERFVREIYPSDPRKEVDRLVDMCPDLVRAMKAKHAEREGTL